jgi:hypothetical protein
MILRGQASFAVGEDKATGPFSLRRSRALTAATRASCSRAGIWLRSAQVRAMAPASTLRAASSVSRHRVATGA